MEHRKEVRGFVYGFLAAVSMAINAILIKEMADIPSQTMVFVRFLMGLPFLVPLIFMKKVHFSIQQIPKHLIRAGAGLLAMYCYFYSIKQLPLVNSVTLANTQPLFIPLVLLVWLRLVVSKIRFGAAVVGFAGVLTLLRPSQLLNEWASLVGLVGGLVSAIAMVGVRALSKEESPQAILCYYFLIGTVFSFFPMLFGWEPIPDLKHWLFLGLIGIVAAVYQYFLTLSYTFAPASKVSTMNYVGVILGGLAGWFVFDEVPDRWVLLGSVLIIASALIALFDHTPPRELPKR